MLKEIPANGLGHYSSSDCSIRVYCVVCTHLGYATDASVLLQFLPICPSCVHTYELLFPTHSTHRVINGVSGLMDELTIELYDASDCEDEDYIFTSNNLMFGEYQVFDEVSVAE